MISERKLVRRWFREGSLERKVFWKMRQVWEPYIGKFKERGETKLFGWRKEVARVFISPEGKEYVRSGPHDPVQRTLRHEGLPDVRLTRLHDSHVGRMLAKRDAEVRERSQPVRKLKRRGARR
jgi:hypothetical protein